MKHFLIIVFSMLSISCKNISLENKNPVNSRKVEVQLIDSLGIITFNCPKRYDTSFSWTHYSDCNTCHDQKYRFQSKINPIIKEASWLWDMPKDSVDRFTISHKRYPLFHTNDTSKDLASHNYFKKELSITRNDMRVIMDTLYKINDRYFSIFEMENTDSIHKKEILAISKANGNFINFSCELMTGINDSLANDFFRSSINLINSIVILNGK